MKSFYANIGTSERIMSGDIKIISKVFPVSFTKHGLKLQNGTELEAELVVLATGFERDYRVLASRFIGEKLAAILTTLNKSNSPEMTPVWYEFRDGHIWLNGDKTRIWLKRMEETGRVTFFVMDPVNLWRWVQVYGKVVEASEDPGGDHINSLSHRYMSRDYPGDRSTRRWLKVEITSVKGADGNREIKWDVGA